MRESTARHLWTASDEMLWPANTLASSDEDECESQRVLQRGSARSLVGLEVRMELVPSSAFEVDYIEFDQTVAEPVLCTAVAWIVLHSAVDVAVAHYSPADLLLLLEHRLTEMLAESALLLVHLSSASSADSADSASLQHRVAFVMGGDGHN